jgi:hypothetical protein
MVLEYLKQLEDNMAACGSEVYVLYIGNESHLLPHSQLQILPQVRAAKKLAFCVALITSCV